MQYLPHLLIALSLLLLIANLGSVFRSRRMQGREAPPLTDLFGDGAGAPRLVYFHSSHCPPCRAMTPVVEQLAREHAGVLSIDVGSQREAARRYGIVATPTLVLVREGRIARVLLGSRSQAEVEALLQ